MLALSDKQRAFIRAYIPPGGNFNATAAARVAGYSWPDKAGPRVSRSPKVAPLLDLWFCLCYTDSPIKRTMPDVLRFDYTDLRTVYDLAALHQKKRREKVRNSKIGRKN